MHLVEESRSRFGDKLDWPERGQALWMRAREASASDADAGELTDAIAQHAFPFDCPCELPRWALGRQRLSLPETS